MLAAFARLNQALEARNRTAVLGLVGGAVMTLVYESRKSTEDVDAWMDDPDLLNQLSASIATELGLPQHWLNDAAKEFLPSDPNRFERWREFSHLTIMVARPDVMLVMKLHAARLKDLPDIRVLLAHTKRDFASALVVYRAFYGVELDPSKRLLLRDALEPTS